MRFKVPGERKLKPWKGLNWVPCPRGLDLSAPQRAVGSLKAPGSAADVFLEHSAINLGKRGVVRVR